MSSTTTNRTNKRTGTKFRENDKLTFKKVIYNILVFLNNLKLHTVIIAGAVLFILTGLYIHFIYMPDGYYFWEELPTSNCIGDESAITLNYENDLNPDLCSYNDAYYGKTAWINYFGKVSIRSEADKSSDLLAYASYKDQIGIFGEETNGYYYTKYIDDVLGKTLTGYVSSDCISYEEVVSSKEYLSVPMYMQTDPKWGDVKIGGYETLASAGCTTTCLAMAYSCIDKETVLPTDIVDMLYYDYDGNLKFPDEYIRYRNNNYLSDIYTQLQKGIPVLVGCFRYSGFPHWCVVYGYNGDGETLAKKDFMIYDPYTTERTNLQEFFNEFPVFNKIAYYNK